MRYLGLGAALQVMALLLGHCNVMAQTSSASRQAAPAPRMDLAGFWETDVAAALISGELAANPAPPAAVRSSAPVGSPDPIESAFLGRTVLLGKPPYNPEWEARVREAAANATPQSAAPTGKACSQGGFPFVMDNPTPDGMFQVVLAAQEALMLFPDGGVRQIYMDGRAHPKPEDLWPTQMGDSIGHWDRRTLIIDTIARKAGPIAPIPLPWAAQLSEAARFEERISLRDANDMEDDMTIIDPARFAHPWRITIRYRRVRDLDRMITINCSENDRNPVVDGKVVITPP